MVELGPRDPPILAANMKYGKAEAFKLIMLAVDIRKRRRSFDTVYIQCGGMKYGQSNG